VLSDSFYDPFDDREAAFQQNFPQFCARIRSRRRQHFEEVAMSMRVAGLAIWITMLAFGQAMAPQFEVASIKLSKADVRRRAAANFGRAGLVGFGALEISAKAAQPIDDDVLEVAKGGSKLEKAEPGEASTNTETGRTGVTIDAHRTNLDSFARILARKTEQQLGLRLRSRKTTVEFLVIDRVQKPTGN
jgi:hypothetical protein